MQSLWPSWSLADCGGNQYSAVVFFRVFEEINQIRLGFPATTHPHSSVIQIEIIWVEYSDSYTLDSRDLLPVKFFLDINDRQFKYCIFFITLILRIEISKL